MKKINGQSDLQIANVERAPLKLQSHQVKREREDFMPSVF
jgi:hypothetical protein